MTIYFPDKDAMYARNPRLQFIADRLGTRQWCVAHRLTDRLKRQGYERVVSSKTLQAIEREWEHANPDDARQYGGRLLHELRLSEAELLAVRAALSLRIVEGSAEWQRTEGARITDTVLQLVDALLPSLPVKSLKRGGKQQ